MTPIDLAPIVLALGALGVALRGNRRSDFDSLRDELRKQLDAAALKVRRLEERVAGLEQAAESLEQQVAHLTTWRSVAVYYIHKLQTALRAAGVPVPDAPAALDLTNDHSADQ